MEQDVASCLFARRREGSDFPGSLVCPDPPVPGKQLGPGGRFIVGASELLAVSWGSWGWGKGFA